MKLILAGFPKTGTKSSTAALQELGYNVCDYIDMVEHTSLIWQEFLDGKVGIEDVIETMESAGFDTHQDTPACFMWEEFFRARPDSKVILCVRESDKVWADSWIRFNYQIAARNKFCFRAALWAFFLRRGWYGPRWQAAWNAGVETQASFIDWRYDEYYRHWTYSSYQEFLERQRSTMEKNYRSHINNVKAIVPKDQLLIWNIKDGWEPLCQFLKKPVPSIPFPYENKTGDKTEKNKFIEKYVFESEIMKEGTSHIRYNCFLYIVCPVVSMTALVTYVNFNDVSGKMKGLMQRLILRNVA